MTVRIATRGSKLALAQTEWVAGQLRSAHPDLQIEIIIVVTRGDRELDRSLTEIGGKGLFVTEVEAAVQDHRADLAVHSLKDMPAELGAGLVLACVPVREDPRDVLVTRQGLSLDDLTSGDRIGTNSPRRRVQLQRLRPDLQYAFLRGNIDTRIAKLERGDYQAIVLAHAGLRRLGLASRPLAIFSVDEVIPAVGQGILALETRADDPETRRLLVPLENAEARAMAEAERAYLHALGGDCNTPLAGHARLDARTGLFRFDAMVGSPTESLTCVTSVERYLTVTGRALASQTRELGREAAHALLDQGARAFIEEARVMARPGSDPRSN